MKYIPKIEDILDAVSAESGIPEEVIVNPSIRTKPVIRARHVAIYLACKNTWRSRRDIADHFNQDHTALYHGLNKISTLLHYDQDVKRQVAALTKRLGLSK